MGNPLSPLLADIFMDNFESNLLNNKEISLINNIKFWYRYVNDVLYFWNSTDRKLDQFSSILNSINENIKFTIEKETDAKINFLDLTITRENNKFLYKFLYEKIHIQLQLFRLFLNIIPTHTYTTYSYAFLQNNF